MCTCIHSERSPSPSTIGGLPMWRSGVPYPFGVGLLRPTAIAQLADSRFSLLVNMRGKETCRSKRKEITRSPFGGASATDDRR
jgi:hypothetical protein